MKWLVIFGTIAIIIGGGVLLGAYLPNTLFNQRIVGKICHRYAGVRSYTCRYGAITHTCYDVRVNTQPEGVNCWQSTKIATFTNQQQADSYASRYHPYDFNCYWDWKNACNYYNGPADVTGTLYAGITFTSVAALLFGIISGIFVYNRWKHRKYQLLVENTVSV